MHVLEAAEIRELVSGMQQQRPNRPLSALLSQALVAFTVELDNEFERRMTEAGYSGARLSLIVWSNVIRFIPDDGISVRDLAIRSLAGPKRIGHMLGCLERWGFVVLDMPSGAEAADARVTQRSGHRHSRVGWGSGRGISSGWTVRLSPQGLRAKEVWRPLLDTIEQRWNARFGNRAMRPLRESLEAIVAQIKVNLPDGFVDVREMAGTFPPRSERDRGNIPLPALLSRALFTFALEFEPKSLAPLALCANALRVLGEKPIPERDIPLLTGGSLETAGLGWQHKPYVVIEPDERGKRGKLVRLTERGLQAQRDYWRLVGEIESDWESRFGKETVRSLRESLRALFDAGKGNCPLISEALIPPPGVVRAGHSAPALGRRKVAAAARKRMRDLVAQTESFIADPSGRLPHYPLWDMNRGFGP